MGKANPSNIKYALQTSSELMSHAYNNLFYHYNTFCTYSYNSSPLRSDIIWIPRAAHGNNMANFVLWWVSTSASNLRDGLGYFASGQLSEVNSEQFTSANVSLASNTISIFKSVLITKNTVKNLLIKNAEFNFGGIYLLIRSEQRCYFYRYGLGCSTLFEFSGSFY